MLKSGFKLQDCQQRSGVRWWRKTGEGKVGSTEQVGQDKGWFSSSGGSRVEYMGSVKGGTDRDNNRLLPTLLWRDMGGLKHKCIFSTYVYRS